jgi:hypothetical protein
VHGNRPSEQRDPGNDFIVSVVQQCIATFVCFFWAFAATPGGIHHTLAQRIWIVVGVWGSGVWLGLGVGFLKPHWAWGAQWAWTLPVCGFSALAVWDMTLLPWRAALGDFFYFGNDGEAAIGTLLFTYPAWCAASYSVFVMVGASIGRAVQRRESR